MGESTAHRELKRLAMAWARASGFELAAMEVRLPRSAYRADVAAAMRNQLQPDAATAVFECKVSRADLRRDCADELETKRLVSELSGRLMELNRMIGEHRPDLRRGEELFPDFECVDLRGMRHERHRSLTRELRAAQTALYEGTKFARLARWRAASVLYLVLETADLVSEYEVPAGWGLLVREGEALQLRRAPERRDIPLAGRIALLEQIALAAQRTLAL